MYFFKAHAIISKIIAMKR